MKAARCRRHDPRTVELALAVRASLASWLWLAVRGDVFSEDVGQSELGEAGAIFFPADRVASLTVGLEARPKRGNLSLRLEYRHDDASAPMYFDEHQLVFRPAEPFQPTAKSQDTFTLGVVGWF